MFKKVVLILLLLIALLSSLFLGYLYFQSLNIKRITNMIEQLSPLAEIETNDVTIDFDGNVNISNIDIFPVGFQNQISINRIEYNQGSTLDLLADYVLQKNKRLNLDIKITSMVFDLNSDFMDKFHKSRRGEKQDTFWGLACGQNEDFLTLVDEVGLSKTHSDATMKIRVSETGRILKTSLSLNSLGFLNAELELDFNSRKLIDISKGQFLREAHITRGSLKVSDNGFNIKRLKYCASQEEVSEASYLTYFEENIKQKLSNGSVVNQEALSESVIKFIEPKAVVSMKLEPENELYLADVLNNEFDFTNDQELVLAVNGKNASIEYLPLLNQDRLNDFVSQPIEQEESLLAEINTAEDNKKAKKASGYYNIELAELASLEGQEIRIRTLLGKEIDGVLMEVSESRIILKRRVEQGWVSYPVTKSDIASLKVYQ